MKPRATPADAEDFHRAWGGAAELPPEVRLWRAVLTTAIGDSLSPGTHAVNRSAARCWLSTPSLPRALALEAWAIESGWFTTAGLANLRARWREVDSRLQAGMPSAAIPHTEITAQPKGLGSPACSGMSQ